MPRKKLILNYYEYPEKRDVVSILDLIGNTPKVKISSGELEVRFIDYSGRSKNRKK